MVQQRHGERLRLLRMAEEEAQRLHAQYLQQREQGSRDLAAVLELLRQADVDAMQTARRVHAACLEWDTRAASSSATDTERRWCLETAHSSIVELRKMVVLDDTSLLQRYHCAMKATADLFPAAAQRPLASPADIPASGSGNPACTDVHSAHLRSPPLLKLLFVQHPHAFHVQATSYTPASIGSTEVVGITVRVEGGFLRSSSWLGKYIDQETAVFRVPTSSYPGWMELQPVVVDPHSFTMTFIALGKVQRKDKEEPAKGVLDRAARAVIKAGRWLARALVDGGKDDLAEVWSYCVPLQELSAAPNGTLRVSCGSATVLQLQLKVSEHVWAPVHDLQRSAAHGQANSGEAHVTSSDSHDGGGGWSTFGPDSKPSNSQTGDLPCSNKAGVSAAAEVLPHVPATPEHIQRQLRKLQGALLACTEPEKRYKAAMRPPPTRVQQRMNEAAERQQDEEAWRTSRHAQQLSAISSALEQHTACLRSLVSACCAALGAVDPSDGAVPQKDIWRCSKALLKLLEDPVLVASAERLQQQCQAASGLAPLQPHTGVHSAVPLRLCWNKQMESIWARCCSSLLPDSAAAVQAAVPFLYGMVSMALCSLAACARSEREVEAAQQLLVGGSQTLSRLTGLHARVQADCMLPLHQTQVRVRGPRIVLLG